MFETKSNVFVRELRALATLRGNVHSENTPELLMRFANNSHI